MASKGYRSAGALLVILGAFAGACETNAAGTPPAAGELAIEWQPPPEAPEASPRLELEVRKVSGGAAIRRRIVLGATYGRQARLALPPGVYAVQVSSAALQPGAVNEQAVPVAATQLQLPPPSTVLISPASTARARITLADADAGPVASLHVHSPTTVQHSGTAAREPQPY